MENSEISESFLLLQILKGVVNLDAKTTKKSLRQKLKVQDMLLVEKVKVSEVSEFWILFYT